MVKTRSRDSNFDCVTCIMRKRSDWSVLSRDEVALLASGQSSYSYTAGEAVYSMGAAGDGVYCVCSGTVAIRRLDAEGNSVLLQLAYPGDTLGYEAVLTGEPHRCSAEALGPANVCHINTSTVKALLEQNPNLGLQFLRRTAASLDDAQDKLVHHATLSNRAKLAHLLLILMDRYGRRTADGTSTLHLPVSRRDLASMIGTRHETVSRIIGRFENDGIAYFSGRSVRIPQVNALIEEIRPQLVG